MALRTRSGLAAEGLGDDHGAAGGDAGEQGCEQEDYRKADAHGGQGSVADKVAHHPAIHHIVELLQKIPRQQRQGKHQNMAEGTARRHIPDSAFRPHDAPQLIKSFYFTVLLFTGKGKLISRRKPGKMGETIKNRRRDRAAGKEPL